MRFIKGKTRGARTRQISIAVLSKELRETMPFRNDPGKEKRRACKKGDARYARRDAECCRSLRASTSLSIARDVRRLEERTSNRIR